jgi:D-aminopeptidase
MRPRKVVLLYCADDQRRSELALILDLRLYRVIAGISQHPPLPDCALVIGDRDMVRVIKRELPTVPIIAIVKYGYSLPATVLRPGTSTEQVLELIRVAVIRKRGPVRGYKGAKEVTVA